LQLSADTARQNFTHFLVYAKTTWQESEDINSLVKLEEVQPCLGQEIENVCMTFLSSLVGYIIERSLKRRSVDSYTL
jgi:hypothetical protein